MQSIKKLHLYFDQAEVMVGTCWNFKEVLQLKLVPHVNTTLFPETGVAELLLTQVRSTEKMYLSNVSPYGLTKTFRGQSSAPSSLETRP